MLFRHGRKRPLLSTDRQARLWYTFLMSKTLVRTICIKLDVDGHENILAATQRAFNDAATWISLTCWREGITNTNTAHHRVYGETRSRFGLGAQLAVCARAKAMEAIKAVKTAGKNTCPLFGPRGSIRYDARTYRLMSLDRVSLNTLSGRVVLVDPRNTSKTCSQCGYCSKKNRQTQASFKCRQCGHEMNADVNAAINISRAAVKPPMVASAGGR